MLPRVLDAKRAILIAPASLREKTRDDRTAYAAEGWRLASPPPRFVSLEELATEGGADLLNAIKPDLIILDEADELSNPDSSAAVRIDRYVVEHWEDCTVVAMSGTPVRKSIRGYWHILAWCLKDNLPLPFTPSEVRMWDAALGEHNGRRPRPGPLGSSLDSARRWLFTRLAETPGVVIVDGDSCNAPLSIAITPAEEDRVIDAHYQTFLEDLQNPAGIPCADPLARWRTDAQLGSGFYMYWDPMPPEEWAEARRNVARFVRGVIERTRSTSRPCDTEAQVLRRFRENKIVKRWRELKPTFTPNTRVEWVSDSVVRSAKRWNDAQDGPAILWVGSPAFGKALAKATGLEYYANNGKNSKGQRLHAADESRSMIVSWNANKRGFNLQPWRHQLVLQPPTSAKYLEQMFGRSHRSGQEEEVRVTIMATSGGTYDALDTALAEARFAKGNVGLTQKILRARIERIRPRKTATNSYRWATAKK
jgi:hypothetical protein